MTIIGAICQRVPGSAATVSDPGGGGTPSGTGENGINNSKLSGSESDEADNWGIRFPGEGTVAFAASAVEDHRKVRFTATGPSDRAAIDQDINVEIGQVYTISCYVVAVDEAATNPSTVILSHAPFGRATIINGTARPTVSGVGPGEWHSYTVEIVSAGVLTIVVGCDNAGDVTVERIMVDPDEDLRTYDATDPTEAPDPVSGLEFLPHHGYGCGTSTAFGDGQFPLRINSNFVGWGIGIPAGIPSTAVDYFFTQLRSNRGPAGEDNKSRVNGNYPHGAYTWDFRVNCYVSNSTFTTVGSLVWTLDDSYTNSMTSDYEGYPVRHFTPPTTWTVEGGEYYIIQFENLESNPDNTYFSLNSSHAQRATSAGLALDPPRAASPSPAYGNSPIVVSGPNSSSVSPYYRGIVGGTGLKLTSGVEIGSSGQDGTGSAMRKAIYGTRKWRQKLVYPWWAQADKLWHGVWRDGTPAGNLVITLTGPNISETWNRVPGNVPSWNPSTTGLPPRTVETFDLSTWEADEIYTVEISAPSATQTTPYYIGSVRASAPSNQYSDEPVWEQHYPGYPSEYSEDGGSSWLPIGWDSEPFGVGNVWVDFAQRVAATEGALPVVLAAMLFLNPFSAESAYHRPIGDGATYASDAHASRVAWTSVVPANNGQDGGGTIGAINQGNPFGVAAMLASGSDPLRTVSKRNCTDTGTGAGNWDPGGTTVQIRIPDTNGVNTNASYQCFENTSWIVQEDYSAYEFFQTNRSGDTYRGSICRVMDVRGLGHGSALGERVGVSASGCSVRMGMLSVASLLAEEEIGHALKLAIYSGTGSEAHELLSRNIQWPACNADSFASNPANNNGPFPYGSLLALKPDIDLDSLGLTTPQGYILGRAMRDYGCYAMDDANGIVLRADGSLGANATAIVADYRKLLRHLYLVTNSVTGATASIAADGGYNQTGSIGTPSYPAGGGTALAPNTALIG